MKPPIVALYDANVLFPAPLRDLLLRLAEAGLVRPRWTDAIHEEWIRGVLNYNPRLSAENLARTRARMNAAFIDCVVTDYESLIDAFELPDSNDWHVLAAAVHARCEMIVTCNLDDFPVTALAPYGVKAMHPDEFVAGLFGVFPDSVLAALSRQRSFLQKPTKSVDQFLDAFVQIGLLKTVELVKPHSKSL